MRGGLGGGSANKFATKRGGTTHDSFEHRLADPRGPLGLDYRQIPVEHFFVGVLTQGFPMRTPEFTVDRMFHPHNGEFLLMLGAKLLG